MPCFFILSSAATLEDHLRTIWILTYAYGDVSRPLIVVLAVDGFLSDQLEAKLALEPEDPSV